jgi:acyl dehydratase
MTNPQSKQQGFIENRTFDEIQIGDSASLQRRLTLQDIKLFAAMSGDVNPAHVDEDYARSSRFHEIIAHGMWGGALISTVLGTQLPGPGTIYLNQSLSFRHPSDSAMWSPSVSPSNRKTRKNTGCYWTAAAPIRRVKP